MATLVGSLLMLLGVVLKLLLSRHDGHLAHEAAESVAEHLLTHRAPWAFIAGGVCFIAVALIFPQAVSGILGLLLPYLAGVIVAVLILILIVWAWRQGDDAHRAKRLERSFRRSDWD